MIIDIKTPNGFAYKQPVGLFINNEFVASEAGQTIKVINPSTEEHICDVQEALEADVERAIDAAEAGFQVWRNTDPAERGRILTDLANLIRANHELLSSIEAMDNGKAMWSARGDVTLVENVIRNCGGWADKYHGELVETDKDHFNYTRQEPIGVCGQIIPWNFPLAMWAWKVGPALAMGNSVVLKTAESTPLSALFACQLAVQAGLPKGVMNVIVGYGKIGALLASSMRIKKVAFTGSTAVGRLVAKAAAESNLKRVSLELGGKSPFIVFDDCDVKKAAKLAHEAIFYNSGEVCTAGSRLYVQESIYEEFEKELKAVVANTKVGSPYDPENFYGPQVSQVQLDRVLKYIDVGKQEGARLVTGGQRYGSKGYFVQPTVFDNVTEDMRIVKEEIFGPVVVMNKFKDEADIIKLANASDYGLAAGIMTTRLDRAVQVANQIDAGSVWVNTYNDYHAQMPFGGFGVSGMGRELGSQVFHSYTETKAVRMKFAL